MDRLLQKNRTLQAKTEELASEIQNLQEKLENRRPQSDTIEYRGVKIIGKSRAMQEVKLECAKCEVLLKPHASKRHAVLCCPKCGFNAGFSRKDLPRVLAQLPQP